MGSQKEIWLATGNPGKKREFLRALSDFQVYSQGDLDSFTPPEETGKTFLENARLKAQALQVFKKNHWILADDSGLIVEDLGGEPGLHSSRYAGPRASDSENRAQLLKKIQEQNLSHPSAFFHCTLVVLDPQGKEHIFQGDLWGSVASVEQGEGGFGYDPLFIPRGSTRTLAQHTDSEKQALSHRGKALRAFQKTLRNGAAKVRSQ